MPRIPNIAGGGPQTNINGLSFEGRTNLLDSFSQNDEFDIKIIAATNSFTKYAKIYYNKKNRLLL